MDFADVEKRYQRRLFEARLAVAREATQIAPCTFDGVAYTVRWGAEGCRYEMNTVDVIIEFTGPDGHKVKLKDMPRSARDASDRGFERLMSWKQGSGPFPVTVDALFAEGA